MLGIHGGLIWFEKMISAKIAMKRIGFSGPDPSDDKETTCMNRVIGWSDDEDRIECECDPRHSQMIKEQLGPKEDRKGVSTPGVSLIPDPNSAPLNARERTVLRSVTMRTAYQAIDRPELLSASQEAARSMQNPILHDMNKLKRIGRFLVTAPRTVQYFPRQGVVKLMVQHT